MQETRVWFLTRKIPWQPTPVFLSGNPMDRGAWRAAVLGVTKSQTWFSNQKKKKKTPKQTRLHAKQSSGNQGKNPQSFVTRTTFLSATCQGLKLKIFSFLWEFSTKYPWRRKWQFTPVFLPGKSHGWRSLVGYSPCGRKELDTTERLPFHFHFHFHH